MDPGQQKSEEIWAMCITGSHPDKGWRPTKKADVYRRKRCERSLICAGCVGWVVDLLDFVGGLK